MSIKSSLISTMTVFVVGLAGIASLAGFDFSGTAFAASDPIRVEVKIISNNNRTFALEVPPLTQVDCSNGAVGLTFA